MTSFYHVIARYMRMTCRARAGVNVIEMSEPSTGDREVSEQGCKAQITHVIFDCDGLMLGRLAKLLGTVVPGCTSTKLHAMTWGEPEQSGKC